MGRARKGLCFHKSSKRYYVTDPISGKEVYFGKDQEQAENQHHAWRYVTDAEFRSAVDQVRQIEPVRPIIRTMPQAGLLGELQVKAVAQYAKRLTSAPTNGQSQLAKLVDHWIEDKAGKVGKGYRDEIRRSWREFARILRVNRVTDLDQLDEKRNWRAYRTAIETAAQRSDKPAYYADVRYRRIKAVINHLLSEFDLVSPETAAVIESNMRLLKGRATEPTETRPITPEELHAMLAICDQLAATDPSKIREQIRKTSKGTTTYQCLAGRLRQVDNARFLGVQYRAIYLSALSCMFGATDIGTIPRTAANLDNGHITFSRRKKYTPRVGLLLPEALAAVKAWMEYRTDDSPLLFVNVRGNRWNQNSIKGQIDKHKAAGGISDDLTFGAFRDGGYAAALLDPHVDVYTAKIMAGHKTGMTDRYVTAQPERCRLAMESIRRHYFGGNK